MEYLSDRCDVRVYYTFIFPFQTLETSEGNMWFEGAKTNCFIELEIRRQSLSSIQIKKGVASFYWIQLNGACLPREKVLFHEIPA